jgi:hypothetical protein
MTRAIKGKPLGLFTPFAHREGTAVARTVTMGPYTYTPAPAHAPDSANGTLSRGGLPVALQVTEPLLKSFLDTVGRLEADLAQRWTGAGARSAFPRANDRALS